jgi:hypothetical protein
MAFSTNFFFLRLRKVRLLCAEGNFDGVGDVLGTCALVATDYDTIHWALPAFLSLLEYAVVNIGAISLRILTQPDFSYLLQEQREGDARVCTPRVIYSHGITNTGLPFATATSLMCREWKKARVAYDSMRLLIKSCGCSVETPCVWCLHHRTREHEMNVHMAHMEHLAEAITSVSAVCENYENLLFSVIMSSDALSTFPVEIVRVVSCYLIAC